MRKRIKPLGILAGIGDLLLDGSKVATVRYRIQQDQEIVITDAIDGTREEIDGLRSTQGTITPIDGEVALESYTLRMEDGRELDIIVTNMSMPGGRAASGVWGDSRNRISPAGGVTCSGCWDMDTPPDWRGMDYRFGPRPTQFP